MITKKIEIVPCYDCNFRCDYCFIKSLDEAYSQKRMNDDVVEKSIRYVESEYNEYSKDGYQLQLSFFGGEPLLASDIITKFVGALCDKPIKFNIVTNGSLITKRENDILDWKERLDNKLSFMVSFDYSLQDINRCRGTHDKVIEGIQLLDENSIKVLTNTVFNPNDLSQFHLVYNDYLKLQRKLRHNFDFRFGTNLIGIENVGFDEKSIISSLSASKRFIDKHNLKIHYKYTDRRINNCKEYHCGVGWRVLSGLDVDGSLYPCQGAINDKNKPLYKFASVYDDYEIIKSNRDEMVSKLRWKTSKCNECNYVCKHCPLDTVITNYNEFGLECSESHCNLHRIISECLF